MPRHVVNKTRPFKIVHQGAAIAETFVLLLVLVPLALTIPMIGKLVDLKQTSHQASRYAAWEYALSPAPASGDEIKTRFFSAPDLPVRTHAVANQDFGENPLWGQSDVPQGHGADLIALKSGSVTHANTGSELPPAAKAISRGVEVSASLLGFLSSVNWDVETEGMVKPEINLEANTGVLLKSITGPCGAGGSAGGDASVCMKSANAILIDGWGAGSDAQARKRSRAFVPAAVLEPVGNVVSQLGRIPVVKELRGLDDAFGYIDSTQLPLDRYPD